SIDRTAPAYTYDRPAMPPSRARFGLRRRSYASLRRCHKTSPVAMVRPNWREPSMSDRGTIKRRRLGKGGPEVLPIGLGCMSLSGTYGPSDDAAAVSFLERAIELGVDFLDSSDAYGLGQNEEVLGRALK